MALKDGKRDRMQANGPRKQAGVAIPVSNKTGAGFSYKYTREIDLIKSSYDYFLRDCAHTQSNQN